MSAGDWTDWRLAQLRELWAEGSKGCSTAEIGRRIGMPKNAVVGKARRLGLQPRPAAIIITRPYTSDEDAIIADAAADGLNDQQIAARLVDRSSISVRDRRYRIQVELTEETRRRQKMAGTLAHQANARRQSSLSARKAPSVIAFRSQTMRYDSEPKPPRIIDPISAADLHCETVRNDERAHDGCRWLVNDRSPWLACAAKRLSGESYCVHHAARSSYYPREQAA